jgi:hypothetical protein
MGYTYSVSIVNHSSHPAYFMLYQNDPTSWDPNALALAWFAKFSNPGPNALVKFSWAVEWGFSWAETGTLKPGIQYEASDSRTSSPGNNQITLTYNGAYDFVSQQAGADPNRLYIKEDASIPINSAASVGVTMSGSTVYATQARPTTNLTLSPHPTYYLAYGNYAPGDVIDVSTINNPLPLVYQTGVYSLHTTLNVNDTWTPPQNLVALNKHLLAAKSENPKAHWTEL